ncbi:hypothetical protein ACFX11_012316 [Malus domestica]
MGVQFFHEKEADFDGGLFGLRFHLHGLGCAKAKFCCSVLNAFGLGCDSETKRVKVVKHDGWPSWVDNLTIYFYRRDEDQWSVYMAILLREGPGDGGSASNSTGSPHNFRRKDAKYGQPLTKKNG